MREKLRFAGKIISATISRVAERWCVSITVDVQDSSHLPKAENQGAVGILNDSSKNRSKGWQVYLRAFKMRVTDLKTLSKLFWQGLAIKTLNAPGLYAASTGMPNLFLNPVLEIDAVKRISQLEAFYQEMNMPWSIYLDTDIVEPTFLWGLQSLGFQLKDAAFVMDLDLRKYHFVTPDTLQFVKVKSPAEWSDWSTVVTSGFGSSGVVFDDHFQALNQKLSKRKDIQYACFVLYSHGHPVSASSVTIYQNICRLDNIATIASSKLQGFGGIVTKAIMQYAKTQGCEYCCLESASDAFEFYKKIGFKYLSKLEIYSKHSL